MLRMIGYSDIAGFGFPKILATLAGNGWLEPELQEDTIFDQVTLMLKTDLKSGNILASGNERFKNYQENY